MANNTIRRSRLDDHDWMRQSFMIPHKTEFLNSNQPEDVRTPIGDPQLEQQQLRARFFTSAKLKFANTTPGGNLVVNPLPQFTKYCDPRIKGLLPSSDNSLGRWYSDAIDDNKHYITLCAGMAQHNSLSNFWTGFYNSEAALVARTGRTRSGFYEVGRVAGFVVGLFSPWLVALSVGAAFYRFGMGKNQTKYYFFKATMPVYWNAVTGFANELAVRTGLIAPVISKDSFSTMDERDALTKEDVRDINMSLGNLIDSYKAETGEGNGLNVYAFATKYARMAEHAFQQMQEFYRQGDYSYETIDDQTEAMIQTVQSSISSKLLPSRKFFDYLKEWSSSGPGTAAAASAESVLAENGEAAIEKPDLLIDYVAGADGDPEKAKEKADSWSEFYKAELNDGAMYVTLRVDSHSPPSESFQTSVGESEIQTNFNNMSGSARSTRFNMAYGNISDGPIGSLIGAVLQRGADAVVGFADQMGFGGMAALGGNAFVDIPKIVTGSSTHMPSMNYTFKFRTPFGNRFSRFVNIWLPFSLLAALGLPLSTGAASYGSPFFVQLYDRGRAQSRLCVMTNMQVTRGTTNLSFNKIGEPMGIDVTCEFTEMSSVLHMPISSGFSPLKDIKNLFASDESLYNDYLSVLSSLSLREQVYVGERFKLNLTKYLKDADSWFSMAHAMNWMGDLGLSRLLSIAFPGALNR